MRRLFSFRSAATDPKDKNGDKNNTDSESQEDCSSSNDLSLLNLKRSQSFSYPAAQIDFEHWRFPHDCESPLQEQDFSYSPSSKGYNSSPNSPIALKLNHNHTKLPNNPNKTHYSQNTLRSITNPNFDDIYEDTPLGAESDSDEILLKRIKETEDKIRVISNQDYEIEMIKSNKGVCLSSLVCIIREINEDNKNLAIELVSEIKSRLGDRFFAKENLKNLKREFDVRTKRLEREKGEVKLILEREIDRRSNEWSLKIQKFQNEEMRLRERVRELAEQNVALQREVGLFRENESVNNNKINNLKMEMNEMERILEMIKLERNDLLCASKEWQEKYKQVEEDKNVILQNFKEKIEENKGLHETIAKLQSVKSEQEKTIFELVQGFKGKSDTDFQIENFEIVRFASVEQKLRKEIESYKCELEMVKNENKLILNRFKGNLNFINVDLEICARLESLQSKGLVMIDESSQFCEKLLNFVKFKGANGNFDWHELMDYSLKCESMKREIENLKRSFQNIEAVLGEKFKLKDQFEKNSQIGEEMQLKDQFSKDEMDLKLKEEKMINKILKENIFSKELEIKELETEIASLIRKHYFNENEIKRLQDELSCLTNHAKDMKLQLMEKEENIKSLQDKFQETITKMSSLNGSLKTVTKERDLVLQEIKQLREANLKIQEDNILLHKKIEEQDEELLIKEGQIEMIKKPFDRFNDL